MRRRNRGLRVAAVAAVVLACAASASIAAAGGGGSLLAKLRKAKVVNVGVVAQPPYSAISPSGKATGFAPELTAAILKPLGVPRLSGHTATYGNAIPGLLAGRWDIIASALDVTPARCAVVIFSDPIVVDPELLAVKPGNPLHLKSIKDVADTGAKLGVLSGAFEISVAEGLGVSSSNIVQYPDDASELADLKAGRIDAVIESRLGLVRGATWAGDPTRASDFQLTAALPDWPNVPAALAFRKSDVALRNLVNKRIKKLKKTGQFQKLSKKWGFNAAYTNSASTAKACAG